MQRLKLAISFFLLLIGPAAASPEDDRVARYLRENGMTTLLETQLEERIEQAEDEAERWRLAHELSQLYLGQLRAIQPDDPRREIVLLRASSLVDRVPLAPLYELRLELLIDRYSEVESKVELSPLGLLGDDERADAIVSLTEIRRKLDALLALIGPDLQLAERRERRAIDTDTREQAYSTQELRRFHSLAHYYAGWTGYSLAVLHQRHADDDVFIDFGWLVGAQGSHPQLAEFDRTALEYEHVARAALGIAMAYARSDDASTGRFWADAVIESEYTPEPIRPVARSRLLQIYAMARDWTEAGEHARFVASRSRDNLLSVADARFLAIRALQAIKSPPVGRGGEDRARDAARFAIEQLVEHAEIGHVVDLFQRYGTLRLMSDGFVPRYALALAELHRLEQSRTAQPYSTVVRLFEQALDAGNAGEYPRHREDCRLKLAYTQIRAEQPADAVAVCEQIIDHSLREDAIEEARWMRIAALEQIAGELGRDTTTALDQAVREYIAVYPSSRRAAQLILRYAARGAINAETAARTLETIADEDPIAVPARRTLVQLRYQQIQANRYSDQQRVAETLDLVDWIVRNQPDEISDLGDAKARMNTLRIGIDLALRAEPVREELTQELLANAMALLSFDTAMRLHHGELVYRQIELALAQERLGDAIDLLGEVNMLDERLGASARVLMLASLADAWTREPTLARARMIVDIGPEVLARVTPPHPDPLGVRSSGVAELIADAAWLLWRRTDDAQMLALGDRVAGIVLERGQPTESGLRRTASLAAAAGKPRRELEAWLRLLAAYPEGEDRWYEARYQSLRVMSQVDPVRARETFQQFRVLHPRLGPSPWNERIADLFGEPLPGSTPKESAP